MSTSPDELLSDEQITALTYEEAIERLEALVDTIESGAVSLDRTVHAYEQGVKLKKHCEGLLARAEQRVEALKLEDLEQRAADSDA